MRNPDVVLVVEEVYDFNVTVVQIGLLIVENAACF